jgi:hypothetical protein
MIMKKKRKAGEAPTEFYDARALNPAPPTKRKRNPKAKAKVRAKNPASMVRTTIDARTLALATRLVLGE